ncbi:MAG: hypothetical protein ABI435_03620 [Pseudolysinimonas sp.]
MDNEIELINDGDGLAILGDPTAIERFLVAQGLPSRALVLPRINPKAVGTAGAAIKTGSEVAANAGRWVKLTEKSANAIKTTGLMTGSAPGVSRAVLTDKGKISGIVEFIKGPGSLLTNPAVLAGAAGIMAQLAAEQAMDEITAYLELIDEKVDDILRAQKDSALADMIAVGFMIDDAMTIRAEVGRVSEVTWSTMQNSPLAIARTQAYALRQLDALAEKMENKTDVNALRRVTTEAETSAQEWLAVLARCFQLQDGMAVLELDRVLDSSPDELDRHRVGLRKARLNRLGLITRSTERLLARMDAAAQVANTKVLLHPFDSRAVVKSGNHVAGRVIDFHRRLGIAGSRASLEAKPWMEAADDARIKVVATSRDGVDIAKRVGAGTLDLGRSVTNRVAREVAERTRRSDDDGSKSEED